MLMNVVNKGRRDLHRLNFALRIEPAVATAETEHFRDAVAVVQFEKERANDVVQPRTQTATRNDPGARLLRIEKQLRPRPCQFELDARLLVDSKGFLSVPRLDDRIPVPLEQSAGR